MRLEEPFVQPFSHMTIAGQFGVTLYGNDEYIGTLMPSYEQLIKADPANSGNNKIVFDGIMNSYMKNGTLYQTELFMPLYSNVYHMYIGLKKGSVRKAPKAYRHENPVLFYGSSITQGGCASKPGDDYIGRLSRMLDTDFINLGFSGGARGEQVMAEYLAEQTPSVFVLDYDHNAPTAEHLANTHFALYETVRKVHPYTPIIMMTMPNFAGYENREWHKKRRDVIMDSYARTQEFGDTNVYLVDCYGCFGTLKKGECGTVDGAHPDSLGFLRMAECVYPVLKSILDGES